MSYQAELEKALSGLDLPKNPNNLYDPLRYFLDIGGKRTRPTLLLMAHNLFDDNWKQSIHQALAIELFHNFTLIHDDIMDNAALRRNQATVHEKWNRDIAILSGDVLMVKAYQYMMQSAGDSTTAFLKLFNTTAIEVCEGQQMDMDFENRQDVQIEEYIEMIRLKTAVLLACSLKIGALSAGVSNAEADKIYNFGINLGLGFQLQDDFLDSFGDEATFGKQIGGDILNNKKTFLSIVLRDKIGQDQYQQLCAIEGDDLKIAQHKALYIQYALDDALYNEVNAYHQKALKDLESIETARSKDELNALASKLMVRAN